MVSDRDLLLLTGRWRSVKSSRRMLSGLLRSPSNLSGSIVDHCFTEGTIHKYPNILNFVLESIRRGTLIILPFNLIRTDIQSGIRVNYSNYSILIRVITLRETQVFSSGSFGFRKTKNRRKRNFRTRRARLCERRKRRGGNTDSDSIERFYVSVGKRLSGIRRGNGGES